MNIGKALTWDELAKFYDAANIGRRPAKTLPMESVFAWAEQQTTRFFVHPKEETLHVAVAEEEKP